MDDQRGISVVLGTDDLKEDIQASGLAKQEFPATLPLDLPIRQAEHFLGKGAECRLQTLPAQLGL